MIIGLILMILKCIVKEVRYNNCLVYDVIWGYFIKFKIIKIENRSGDF